MRHRNDNMLLRIAQADAYALPYEYVKAGTELELKEALLRFESYRSHPTYGKVPAGCYTDDSQMSAAVAEALIDDKHFYCDSSAVLLTHERWFEYWFRAFKRDPRDGYSRGFQKLLEEAKTFDELRLMLVPNSTKNGAAMRSVPLGVIKDVQELREVALIQAGTTHTTFEGCASSEAVALMSHFALYDRRDFSSLNRWLVTHLELCERFREPWVGRVDGKNPHSPFDVGINTAWAVHTLLTTETSLMGIMRRVIEWGGDTDSVASIAWGIASARYQDEALPEFLERDLEVNGNPKYGPEFLKRLGTDLMEAYA